MDLQRFHPSRRVFIRNLLRASGAAPLLMAALARADGHGLKKAVKAGVQELHGDVRLNGQAAAMGQAVNPGDVCATGADGSCVIVMGEHVYLIRESSEVEFYAEDFENARGSLSGTIWMKVGAMLSVFGETATTITTPMASIGIRGTACYVAVGADRTYACVCYGQADLGGTTDGQLLETVTTTHHESPRYIYPPGAVQRIEKAPVLDHTDAELRMLEALVGRVPPFVGKPGYEPY